jgi:hypothetical protein
MISDEVVQGIAGDKGMGTAFELTETVIHHDWEQLEHGPGGATTRLSLSATLDGTVRGAVHRPAAFPDRLSVHDWQLTGPAELEAVWVQRARRALAQLRLRVAGRPHATPDAAGRWDVSVRQRLQAAGAPEVPGGLAADWPFTPSTMFIDISTGGAGSLLLFGDGPVETDSTRYHFAVGVAGAVAFDQLDPDDRVPEWAQGPVLEAARQAFELRAAADRLLVQVTTGAQSPS